MAPISDDGPFFWHFSSFPSVIKHIGDPTSHFDFENSTGERVLLLLVGVSTGTLFAAVFLLLPFLAIHKTWAVLPRKGRSALYFASLGFGFLFFEITLLQRLTLFLGYPTYSLTVTLASLLIFTGVGALLSERFKNRPRRAMPVLFAAVALFFGFHVVLMLALVSYLVALIALRSLLAAAPAPQFPTHDPHGDPIPDANLEWPENAG